MKLRGMLVASAALGLMAAGAAPALAADEGQVKCAGINSCAGKGECKAVDASHECSGKNSCKGKGWVHVDSKEQCEAQGGTVQE